jgi:hypothetical protein
VNTVLTFELLEKGGLLETSDELDLEKASFDSLWKFHDGFTLDAG